MRTPVYTEEETGAGGSYSFSCQARGVTWSCLEHEPARRALRFLGAWLPSPPGTFSQPQRDWLPFRSKGGGGANSKTGTGLVMQESEEGRVGTRPHHIHRGGDPMTPRCTDGGYPQGGAAPDGQSFWFLEKRTEIWTCA